MKKYLSLLLVAIAMKAQAHDITPADYRAAFEHYDACFILYDVQKDKIVSEYNPANRCATRLSPDSTFKIALSLMAFDQQLMRQNTVFAWDGKKHDLPGWNQDQTPATWLKYSVVWVSQRLTPQLGLPRIQQYLTDFQYGNQDFSGDPGKHNGLTQAWLSSSLQLSAVEQLHFLKALSQQQLKLSHEAMANTMQNLSQGTLLHGAKLYGKTGSGRHKYSEKDSHPSKLRDGWYVGFVEHDAEHYIFVSNLTDKSLPLDQAYGSALLKPITLQLLNQYFS